MNLKKVLIVFCVQLIINLNDCQQMIPTPINMNVPAIGDCPLPNSNPNDKWVTFNIQGTLSRFCYLYPKMDVVTWHEANDQCMKRNATLMSIHEYKTNAIMTFLNGDGLVSFTNYWIGLTSLNGKRGDYEWSDGSARPFTNYANTTYNGSPLPPDVRNQGRCVSMRRASQKYQFLKNIQNTIGLWFKEDCNANHRFICQKRDAATPTAAPPPSGGCPTGWYNANQKCIKYYEKAVTMDKAVNNCMSILQGEVLTIHSQEEQDVVTALTAGRPTPYIGLIHNNTNYVWSWGDESRVNYTNMGIQPYVNNLSTKNCMIVVTNLTQPGKWLRVNCKETHPYMCQTPRNPEYNSGTKLFAEKCNISGFENFIQHRNSCYSVIDSDPQKFGTFADALKTCESFNGAQLVSIVDPFEQAFLRSYLGQNGKTDNYWIGLQSKLNGVTNVSQVFEWTDDWPVYYTNWGKDEPLFPGLPQEECVSMSKTNGTWKTNACDTVYGYICKISSNPFPKLSQDKTGVCPPLNGVKDKNYWWVDLDKRSKYCYWFSTSEMKTLSEGEVSWVDASYHCRRRNGTLASIHSNHDLMLLSSKWSQIKSSYFDIWIGLSKDLNGDFVWEDGSALDFTNWDPNEKIVSKTTDLNDDSGRKCVEVKSIDRMWRQQPCSGLEVNYFVCEGKKIYGLNSQQDSGHSKGLSSGGKAGVAFGVIGGVILCGAVGYFVYNKYRIPGAR